MTRHTVLISRLLVVAALVGAMASLGLAHRMLSQREAPELSAYLLSGGALANLCGGPSSPGHSDLPSCEACRIVDSAVVPGQGWRCAATERLPEPRLTDTAAWPGGAFHLDPSRLVRAPPLV